MHLLLQNKSINSSVHLASLREALSPLKQAFEQRHCVCQPFSLARCFVALLISVEIQRLQSFFTSSCVHSSNLAVKCLQDGCSRGWLLACTEMHTPVPVAPSSPGEKNLINLLAGQKWIYANSCILVTYPAGVGSHYLLAFFSSASCLPRQALINSKWDTMDIKQYLPSTAI